jgi:P-type E1-E2 ATPase
MLEIEIPGWKSLRIAHVVLDLNGTLTQGGDLPDGVEPRLARLRDVVMVHLVTADTRGNAAEVAGRFGLALHLVSAGEEAQQKADVVRSLDAERTVAIGNGANDAEMLSVAAVGIAILGREGAAVRLLQDADVVVSSITDALDLLLEPQRLVATLRR